MAPCFILQKEKVKDFCEIEKKNLLLVCQCYHVSHLILTHLSFQRHFEFIAQIRLCLSLCSCFFWYTKRVLNLFLLPCLLSLMVLIMRCLDNEPWKLWTASLETVSVCSGIHRLAVTTGHTLTRFLVQDLNALSRDLNFNDIFSVNNWCCQKTTDAADI